MLVSKLAKQRIQPAKNNAALLPSRKSPLAYAADKARQRLRELNEAAKKQNKVDPRIPTDWAKFAPKLSIQTGGTVAPFEPYDFQVEVIKQIERSQNTVICKSRQMGVTETIISWLLMRAITEPGFSAVVFSKTQDDASQLGQRIRDMANSLGSLCPKLTTDSQTKLIFKGLGRLYFLPVTARSARGIPSVSVILFDEAAFIDGIEAVYQAAIPTMSMLGDRGKVIFVSTPNGRTGLFYRLLISGQNEAKRVLDEVVQVGKPANNIVPFDRLARHTRTWSNHKWTKILLHWRVHPIYGADPEWATKNREERQLTEAQWNQEYELGFAEGQSNVFGWDLVDQANTGVWSKPQWARRYVAGIDPSYGGADYFTCRVWDVTEFPYRLVAQYRMNHQLNDYNIGRVIELLAPYKPFMVNVETVGGGELIYQEIVRLQPRWKTNAIGMGGTEKLLYTNRLVLMLERSQLVFPTEESNDNPGSEEYKHFVEKIKNNGRVREAEAGWHDDTVMADAVAFALADEIPKPKAGKVAASSGNPIQRVLGEL